MSAAGPETLVTDAELAAAIAEVESLAGGQLDAPTTGSGPAAEIVPIPVPLPPVGGSAGAAVGPAPDATAPPPPAPTVAAPAATPAAAETATPAARPGLVLRVLDTALAVINRPFAALGPGVRALIGALAVVTIVVSLAAALLLPTLVARPSPTSFLREKKPPPPVEAKEPAQAAKHGGGH